MAPLTPAPASRRSRRDGFVVVAQQLLIGVALGFALQVVFDALGLAGQLLANSMGLSFAFNVDPLRGSSTAALGQLYIILATLTFLALDGHLALIEVLTQGFTLAAHRRHRHRQRRPVDAGDLGWTAVRRRHCHRAARRHRAADRQPGVRRGQSRRTLVEPVCGGLPDFADRRSRWWCWPASVRLQEGVAQLIAQGLAFVRALSGI